jgi:TP901 family phage tail tape measure protein
MPATTVDVILRLLGSRKFQAEAAAASASLQGVDKAAAPIGARMKASGAKMAALGGAMTRGVTVPVVAGMGLAVKATMDFDKQLSALGAVSGATSAQMKGLRQQAITLGQETVFSAGEAAKAQTELAKGGMSVNQVMKSMPGTLNLAAAGELALEDAAAASVNTLNLFGLSAGKAGQVADQFATAANRTTADVGDFTDALTSAGSVANMAGFSLRDTNSWLMALADTGLKGARAGTSVRTALVQLLKPSKQQAEAAKAAGLSFVKQNGQMKDQVEIAAMLRNRLGGMTKAQRTALLAQVAGQDGVRALNALYNAGPKRMQAYGKQLAKSGTAAATAAKKQKNFAGTMEQLRGSLETAAIQIGTVLIPVLTKIVGWITKIVNAFSALPNPVRSAIVTFLAFAAAFGPILVMVGKMIILIARVRQALVVLQLALATSRFAFIATWAAALGPIALVIAAIAAVVAIFVVLYKKVGWFRNAVNAVWNWIKSNWPTLLAILSGPVGIAVALIVKNFDKIKAAASGVINWLKGAWKTVTGAVKSAASAISGALGGAFRSAKSAIDSVVGALRSMLDTISDIIGKVQGAPGKALDLLGKVVPGQTGIAVSKPGTHIVGERGPELLNLPTGSRVTPLPQGPLAGAGGGGGDGTIRVPVYLDGRVLTEAVAGRVRSRQARK